MQHHLDTQGVLLMPIPQLGLGSCMWQYRANGLCLCQNDGSLLWPRRRIRAIFGVMVVLMTISLVYLIVLAFRSERSNRLAFIRFSLAYAMILSVAVGIHLCLFQGERGTESYVVGARSIYAASGYLVLGFLVQGFFVCLEGWWIPKAIRVSLHDEPTVRPKNKHQVRYRANNSPPHRDTVLLEVPETGLLTQLCKQQASISDLATRNSAQHEHRVIASPLINNPS